MSSIYEAASWSLVQVLIFDISQRLGVDRVPGRPFAESLEQGTLHGSQIAYAIQDVGPRARVDERHLLQHRVWLPRCLLHELTDLGATS